MLTEEQLAEHATLAVASLNRATSPGASDEERHAARDEFEPSRQAIEWHFFHDGMGFSTELGTIFVEGFHDRADAVDSQSISGPDMEFREAMTQQLNQTDALVAAEWRCHAREKMAVTLKQAGGLTNESSQFLRAYALAAEETRRRSVTAIYDGMLQIPGDGLDLAVDWNLA